MPPATNAAQPGPAPDRGYDLAGQQRAYARWAGFYDLVYDGLTAGARREAVAAASACGDAILEVGAGTGLSLGDYAATKRVTGVDLSEPMLRRAVDKVRRRGLAQVAGLAAMDACRLGFPDAAFDAVVSQFVITLVPDPEGALTEFARVLRPGGEIVLCNHLGTEGGRVAELEGRLEPLVKRVGWSSTFKLSRIENWARSTGLAEPLGARDVFPAGFFKVIRLRRTGLAA